MNVELMMKKNCGVFNTLSPPLNFFYIDLSIFVILARTAGISDNQTVM